MSVFTLPHGKLLELVRPQPDNNSVPSWEVPCAQNRRCAFSFLVRRSSHDNSLRRVCTTVPLYELVTTTEGSCKSVRVVNLPSDDQTMRAPQDSPVKAARVRRVRVMPGPVRLCQLLLRSGQVRYYITRPKSRTMSVTRQLMLPPSIFT